MRGCVRALPVLRRSRFGCAVWACVLGFGFRLRPAAPRGGVGVCVFLCALPAWSPASPGSGCGAGGCALVWVAASPRQFLLGCWGVCVFVWLPRLYPAISGWGVRCEPACWARVSAVFRPSWLGCWGVCVLVRVPRLHPFLPGGHLSRGGVRVLSWVGFAPPLPFGVCFFFLGVVPCRVVALPCRWLAVPVPGLVVSVPPSPLVRAMPSCVFCFFFRPSVVCVGVFGVSLLPVGRCSRFGVAGVWLGGPRVPLGVPSLVPPGWGVWPPVVAWVGGFVAVGLSRAPPPCFFFLGGFACSSLCLPSTGARTGRHSVWSSRLLLVCGFCQVLPRPHGSVGLCIRWAPRPFWWVRFWPCWLGGCARRLREALV